MLFRSKSALLPRNWLARFVELLPIRRVFQCLVVLRERLFRAALLREQIASGFQRISPMGPALIGVVEFRHLSMANC